MSGYIFSLFLLAKVAHAGVTFKDSQIMDNIDLLLGYSEHFQCPTGCRVYSPTGERSIHIENDIGRELYTLFELSLFSPDKPATLAPGNYSLKRTGWDDPEFTFYVVKKEAANYDTPVYTKYGKIRVINQRYVTFLSDGPGFLIKEISGDLSSSNVSVYATGADSIANKACSPVYVARSPDNAARSSIGIRGPIATIDFGTAKAAHYATISNGFNAVETLVGTSSVYVSPGYVGCGDAQMYTNDYVNKVQQGFKVQESSGLCVKLTGNYAVSSDLSAVSFNITNDNLRMTGTGSVDKIYDGTSFDISILWNRQEGYDSTQFAYQLDLLKGKC
ncbi:hypothetical protein PFISCL1PPCAC_3184 [Pristionchus fissidentatus]|uniref:Uncharacterized protein n=1 Tax=Pristionchus fissidentatus TaxID=1538716 RepID=A0AAV5UX84_9BILA|nr:hypothetical protein PFISCL1PPCAC_3184 [Pristionchus fissidentatus]